MKNISEFKRRLSARSKMQIKIQKIESVKFATKRAKEGSSAEGEETAW